MKISYLGIFLLLTSCQASPEKVLNKSPVMERYVPNRVMIPKNKSDESRTFKEIQEDIRKMKDNTQNVLEETKPVGR